MIAANALERAAEVVAERLGLAFPAARRRDLTRGLRAAARDGGFDGPQAFVEALLRPDSGDACLGLLADHLTVGETYFHREQAGLQALRDTILPELVAARRARGRELRLWSAGCCTGEEPYSIAMVLREAVPDLDQWRVTLLATDLSATFLERAAAGVYGSWSFRSVPPEVRRRWFTPTPDRRHAVSPVVRGMVTFARHNLVEGRPRVVADGQAMDVIFCCNVLMYFTPEQAARVVGELHSSLAERGWLVVSPVEAATDLFVALARVPVPGGTLFRRTGAASPTAGPPATAAPPARPRTRPP
ncbi:MAG: protein-glutamate O-methyltransferase CheR, partial [Armatimonadetes bacterium]|nr:protein-glutamate O-methyltransferase CheR [Armatimonadota bacterium]